MTSAELEGDGGTKISCYILYNQATTRWAHRINTHRIGNAQCLISSYGFLSKNRSSGRIGDLPYTVKNNRNFTDPVMGICDKKSTGSREFMGKCPYILYINGQFTVLLQIFRKFMGSWSYFTGFTVYSPGKFTAGKCPVIWKNGAFPGSKFSWEYTVNPLKYGQLPRESTENLQKTVNWPLIYKMYGHFPVNLRFLVLFLSQLPITGSVKLRGFFTV